MFLLIVRGASGSGKTSFANLLVDHSPPDQVRHFSADDYMVNENGEYDFDFNRLDYCHRRCEEDTFDSLSNGVSVVVHNTFTRESEIIPYKEIAERTGARFISVIIENRHESSSVHAVPEQTVMKQAERFTLQLTPYGKQQIGKIQRI